MPTHRVAFSSPSGTAGSEEARRFSDWWEEYRASIGGVDLNADSSMPFAKSSEWLFCENATIGRVGGSMMWAERRPRHIARDGDDRIVFGLNRGAREGHLWLGSRFQTVAPGAGFVSDMTIPMRELYPAAYE
jgi:hypothetical protein